MPCQGGHGPHHTGPTISGDLRGLSAPEQTRRLAALGRAKCWAEALQALHSLRSLRSPSSSPPSPPSSLIAANAVLAGLAKAGSWRRALELLESFLPRASASALVPDLISYSSLALSLERAARWEGAFRILDATAAASLQPDVVLCGTAVSACRSSRWTLAVQMLSGRSLEPNVVLCTSCLATCGFRRADKGIPSIATSSRTTVLVRWTVLNSR